MIKVSLSLGSVNRLTTAGTVNSLIWIGIIVVLFFVSAGITNKIAKTKKTKFISFIVIMLFLVVAASAVVIPIENSVINFETPESVFNFTHSEEIVDIVQGNESCMIIYREGDSTLGRTYVLKSGNRYKMPHSFITKRVHHSLDQNGSFSVDNVRGTNDYYITGSILTYEDSLTIVNSNNKTVDYIDTEIITDSVKVTDVFLYDVVRDFNDDYYLVINDNVIDFKNDLAEEEIAIYQINSDTFDSLLESDSFESINNFSSKHHSYPKDGINYITYNSVPFEITDSFVDFINDRIIFKDYFSEINQDEKIEDLVVFEAPYVPISIWIKTNEDTYFVTINEDFDSTEYTYNLYSQSDYIKKFKSQDFLLEIDGSVSLNEKSIKTYYEHSELPLLEILSSYDAQIKWKNENQVNITLDKKSYLLDVKKNTFYQKHNKKNNILSGFNGGGPYSMYYSDGEYYVDSDTLQCVILELGQKIKIEYDTEKKTVNIITK